MRHKKFAALSAVTALAAFPAGAAAQDIDVLTQDITQVNAAEVYQEANAYKGNATNYSEVFQANVASQEQELDLNLEF